MKWIIILIPIALFASRADSLKCYNTATLEQLEPMQSEQYQIILATMVREYKLYKTECYSDSTYAEYPEIFMNGDYQCLRMFKGYTHSQPTFEGFMEWLKIRLK